MGDHDHRGCEEIAKRLSDELDGECSWWRRLQIRFHTWICPPCKKGQKALQHTVQVLGTMPDQPCIDIDDEEG